MQTLVAVMLLVVGVVHLLPLGGVLGSRQLTRLYGLPFDEPNLAILIRHRAVLFGLLGVFFVYAAFSPDVQALALFAGFVSVGSFLALAHGSGTYNAAVRRVVAADLLALACLVVAAATLLAS